MASRKARPYGRKTMFVKNLGIRDFENVDMPSLGAWLAVLSMQRAERRAWIDERALPAAITGVLGRAHALGYLRWHSGRVSAVTLETDDGTALPPSVKTLSERFTEEIGPIEPECAHESCAKNDGSTSVQDTLLARVYEPEALRAKPRAILPAATLCANETVIHETSVIDAKLYAPNRAPNSAPTRSSLDTQHEQPVGARAESVPHELEVAQVSDVPKETAPERPLFWNRHDDIQPILSVHDIQNNPKKVQHFLQNMHISHLRGDGDSALMRYFGIQKGDYHGGFHATITRLACGLIAEERDRRRGLGVYFAEGERPEIQGDERPESHAHEDAYAQSDEATEGDAPMFHGTRGDGTLAQSLALDEPSSHLSATPNSAQPLAPPNLEILCKKEIRHSSPPLQNQSVILGDCKDQHPAGSCFIDFGQNLRESAVAETPAVPGQGLNPNDGNRGKMGGVSVQTVTESHPGSKTILGRQENVARGVPEGRENLTLASGENLLPNKPSHGANEPSVDEILTQPIPSISPPKAEELLRGAALFRRIRARDRDTMLLDRRLNEEMPPKQIRVPLLMKDRKLHAALLAYEIAASRCVAENRTPMQLYEWGVGVVEGSELRGIRQNICLAAYVREAVRKSLNIESQDAHRMMSFVSGTALLMAKDDQLEWKLARDLSEFTRCGDYFVRICNKPTAYWLVWDRKKQDAYDALRIRKEHGIGLEHISGFEVERMLNELEDGARAVSKVKL